MGGAITLDAQVHSLRPTPSPVRPVGYGKLGSPLPRSLPTRSRGPGGPHCRLSGFTFDSNASTGRTVGVEVLERVLQDQLDRLAGNHFSPTEAQTGKLASLGEVVHQVVRQPERVGGLCNGQDETLGPSGSVQRVVWFGGRSTV